MNELILKINPYHRELSLNLTFNKKEKVQRAIKKLETTNFLGFHIPAEGYQGFELIFDNGDRLQVYEETVIFNESGILQILNDKTKKLTRMFMLEFMKDFGKDILYIKETMNAKSNNTEYRKIK